MEENLSEYLLKKITERMNLVPDDPNLSERGAYDAYLNVTNWIKKYTPETPKDVPVQSEVEEAAKGEAFKYFERHKETFTGINAGEYLHREDFENFINQWPAQKENLKDVEGETQRRSP